MLYINNLTKVYGNFTAVNNLNLHIPKGELFGLVGHNGAGKTTTMKIICGLLKTTYGNVMINGCITDGTNREVNRQIGYVPDFFGVYDNLKVKEYMEFYGSLYGMDKVLIKNTSRDLLEIVNLSDKADNYVDGLSRGMKQRLCVARALIHNPELLIMDEPNSGLDPLARFEMKEILKNLVGIGKTIIISSHILPELAEMCTGIGIMDHGNMVICGKVDEIINAREDINPIVISIIGDNQRACELLREHPMVKNISVFENEIRIDFAGNDEEAHNLIKQLFEQNIMIIGFAKEKANLETLFMEITKNGKGGIVNATQSNS